MQEDTRSWPAPRSRSVPSRVRWGHRLPVRAGDRGFPRNRHRRQAGTRAGEFRRHLALRHDLSSGRADGQPDAVRQPVSGMGAAVARAAPAARAAARGQFLGQGGCFTHAGGPHSLRRQGRGTAGAGGDASGDTPPPRDRSAGVICEHRPYHPLRGHDGGRERAAARSCSATRCHPSSPVASAGLRGHWRCGTIAAPSTIRSTITTASAA